jgi:threonyl-tRNA synthetase
MQDEKNIKLKNIRHSCAHLLASAVIEIYPQVLPTIGPATEDGFYYDFDFGLAKLSANELTKIENKMRELVKNWNSFEKKVVSTDEARQHFANNAYKVEIINDLDSSKGDSKKDEITFYKSGDFVDLCRGGHVDNPRNLLRHFKLLSIAGAYWRGNEKNKMLTRIYGTAFETSEELDNHLKMLEEAKKRDHKKLGVELDLFTFSDYVGSGLPMYTPRGALLRKILNNYIERLQSQDGYTEVWTPQIAKAELFKLSGHYEKYKDDMFVVKSHYSNDEMFLKPMNCPQHTQIYASRPRSYRDLPLRFTDFAMLYRDEKPGQLNGLARVRSFSQDDCHVFCREDQVDEEVDKMLEMTRKAMGTFGFEYRYRLSTRGANDMANYLGPVEVWEKVEEWAVKIMKRNKIDYYNGPGEASFYAPKMDLMAVDALGREWQLSTIQIDFVQPARFGLTYKDSDGKDKPVVMIHRAILGSVERLMMILIEHYNGLFPLWLAPSQIVMLPISENHVITANEMAQKLRIAGVRADVDASAKTIGAKIRLQTLQKVPYMGIIGDKEVESGCVSVRDRSGNDLGQIDIDKLIQKLVNQIENHT